jgi:hypothetical protein
MLGAFAWLCFSKIQAIWTSAPPTERDRWHAGASWALGVAVYLGAVFLSVMVYPLPPLGVGPEILDAAGFDAKSSGVWEAEPHRALAGGVLYFAVMGLCRPFLAWANARPPREQERNVHAVADWRINLGAFVLVMAVLLAIIGMQEQLLAWLAGN